MRKHVFMICGVIIGVIIGLALIFKVNKCGTPYCRKRNECVILLKKGKMDQYRECSKLAIKLK
jgi:hypothetical protein